MIFIINFCEVNIASTSPGSTKQYIEKFNLVYSPWVSTDLGGTKISNRSQHGVSNGK